MSKKRPTDAQLANMLSQPHFGQRRAEQPSQDPITATPMIVGIEDIDFYDRNPRRAPNSKYHEIKASIAAGEMDQPLTITRRPGAPRYMVFKGGNTRLRALKELYAETGDERFRRIHCLFQPWTRESDALLGHLKENDLRGDLVFIDRALAVRDLQAILEEELEEKISPRRLSELLKAQGYTIGRTIIEWFNYTVDVLFQAIPTALQSGMGRPQIERIKSLDRAFGQCWQSLDLGGGDMAQGVFLEVLSRHDAELLDLDAIRRDLETELSVSADIDVQRASLLFGAAIDGHDLTKAPSAKIGTGQDPEALVDDNEGTESYTTTTAVTEKTTNRNTRDGGEVPSDPRMAGGGVGGQSHAEKTGAGDSAETPPAPVAGVPNPPPAEDVQERPAVGRYQDAENPGIVSDPVPAEPTADDLPVLRERAWALARGICVMARLGSDIIHPIPSGVGYLIGPNSYEAIAEAEQQLGPEHINHLRHLWWMLAGISEQFMPGNRAAEYLPDGWRGRPLEEGIAVAREGNEPEFPAWHMTAMDLFGTDQEPRAEAMWQEMPPASINFHGALLWPRMSDYARRSLFVLLDVYCAIHKACNGKVWG